MAWIALRKTRNDTYEQANRECNERLAEARQESEKYAKEVHELRMRLNELGG